MVLAFYTFSHYHLSVYQVLLNYLQYFKIFPPDKLIIAKIRRELLVIIMIKLWFLHTALLLMTFYQCIKFYLIPFYTFRYMLRERLNIAEIKKGRNSVNTGDRIMIFAFCNFPHGPLSVYQVSLNSLA